MQKLQDEKSNESINSHLPVRKKIKIIISDYLPICPDIYINKTNRIKHYNMQVEA
jgi:hypothetical protein